MSIASRINEIGVHLTKDWRSIEALTGEAEVDKNIENIATVLDNLWEEMPKVTGTGESLTLNTKKGKMKVNLLGNTSQYTTTGKNTFNNTLTNGSNNSLTWVVNADKSVKVTGTASATTYITLGTWNLSGNYIFSGITGGSRATYRIYLSGSLSNLETITDTEKSITNDGTSYSMVLRVESGKSVNEIVYPMIRPATISSDTYEPYTNGASPNPDYPQDVHVVTGDNTIDICGKNLLPVSSLTTQTKNGIAFTNNEDGSYTFNGTASAYTSFLIFQDLSFSGNYTYVLKDTATSGFTMYIQKSTGAGISDATTYRTINNDVGRLLIGIQPNTTLNNLTITPYVYKGNYDSSTTYEPYTSTSYPIHLGEYELCKIGDYKDRFFKNIPNTTDYKSDLEDNEWYLEKKIRHLSLAIADMNNNEDYPGWKNVPYIIEDLQGQGYIENLTSFKSNITDKSSSIAITTHSSILYLDKTYGFGLTQTQWKTNYPNLVFELYYGLQTPTYTPITGTLKNELEAVWRANSYKGTTNISQVNNDLPFNLDITALAGETE